MTKDEMKNRISMALKDPILQQGFEIICKENAQLTKATELLRKFLDAKNIEERCVAESEADHFLSRDEFEND